MQGTSKSHNRSFNDSCDTFLLMMSRDEGEKDDDEVSLLDTSTAAASMSTVNQVWRQQRRSVLTAFDNVT